MPSVIKAAYKFIDKRDHLIRKVEAKERAVLYQTGAYARTTIRRSMRKGNRKKPAKPNAPPRRFSGGLYNLTKFAFSERAAVLVGPEVYHPRRGAKRRRRRKSHVRETYIGAKNVPELLEKGGTRIYKVTGQPVKRYRYGTHKFIQPAIDLASQFMAKKMKALNL